VTKRSVTAGTPRNPLLGPAVRNTNLAIARTFTMPYNEAHHLELHVGSFNTLNTARARVPLKITATKIDNRELQLGVKYLF